jgi:hypothetical protein
MHTSETLQLATIKQDELRRDARRAHRFADRRAERRARRRAAPPPDAA